MIGLLFLFALYLPLLSQHIHNLATLQFKDYGICIWKDNSEYQTYWHFQIYTPRDVDKYIMLDKIKGHSTYGKFIFEIEQEKLAKAKKQEKKNETTNRINVIHLST